LSTSASNQDEKFHLQNNQHIKTSTNTENNSACHTTNQASLNVSPYSDTSSTNLSGNTSINYLSSNSSTSSPSSTSPSQSLSNINIQHQHQAQPQQQQQQQQQYISDQSNQQIHYQIESNNHFDPETVSELVFSTGSTNYSNQASSTNSSSAPTPTPQHQQNLIYQQQTQQTQSQQMHLQHLSNEISTKVLSASSASSLSSSTPPPPAMTNINMSNQINEQQQQQQQQHHAYHNGYTSANSGTQSPVLANATNSNSNLSNGAVLQNLINKNLHGDLTNNNLVANENNNNATNVVLSSIEKRHAQNMIGDLTLIDKNNLNNYQVRVVFLLSVLSEECHNLLFLFDSKALLKVKVFAIFFGISVY
jgi:hypothetical protein